MNNEIKEKIQYLIDNVEYETQPLIDYITNLQEENDRLTNELNKNMIERNNYLSRNEKAIEYIKNNIADIEFIKKQYIVIYDDYVETTINDIEKLLNILQGEYK